jgi:hypothetical protein
MSDSRVTVLQLRVAVMLAMGQTAIPLEAKHHIPLLELQVTSRKFDG